MILQRRSSRKISHFTHLADLTRRQSQLDFGQDRQQKGLDRRQCRNLLDLRTGIIRPNNSEGQLKIRQGLPQWIVLQFASPVKPHSLSLTFQGGFVGTRCVVSAVTSASGGEWEVLAPIYPQDVNRKQVFPVHASAGDFPTEVTQLKLSFEESSDFFGRVTLYDLTLYGSR